MDVLRKFAFLKNYTRTTLEKVLINVGLEDVTR